VSLASLNLCAETIDGIANHSWSRPAPSTPEGEVVSWADRIAYVCHDWEDAVLAGIVAPHQLPPAVRSLCGERRSAQLGAFIAGVVSATLRSGQVGMEEEEAEALAAFRSCNYERIYLRDASLRQGEAVVGVLRALVEHFSDRPHLVSDGDGPTATAAPAYGPLTADVMAGSPEALQAAVTYVAGMTDRFAFRQAVALLGWDPDKLPAGVDG
jgi:dGTPase